MESNDISLADIGNKLDRSNSLLTLMPKFNDEADDKLSFFDAQKILKNYSKKKSRSLSNVLIDIFHNHASENKSLPNKLNNLKIGNIFLFSRNFELKIKVIEIKENKIFSDKVKRISSKGWQLDFYKSWKEVKKGQSTPWASVEWNKKIEKDLKSTMSWTNASLLENIWIKVCGMGIFENIFANLHGEMQVKNFRN